ncbi:alpha/beta hydrolase [Altererythrobacter sp.]|uniref:alpha/beta hydrolase n=1 Tax=Altererythrobacter sp. TaxID=1872480 RepID=UPI003D11393D
MRSLVILLLALAHAIAIPLPASAQGLSAARVVAVEGWVEEWDEAAQSWVRISEPTVTRQHIAVRSERLVGPQLQAFEPRDVLQGASNYGPFRVLDGKHAALMGVTDRFSPGQFQALLRDNPGVEVLELIEAPGTRDDIANLALGRMIHAAGIATHVPAGGSVRSGAVELFLAGAERSLEDGAQFAVHSWIDTYGREPGDFALDAPENRLYLDYYREMGMSQERAEDFYALTNSVPHDRALWLTAADMRGWIARLDSGPSIH